MFDPYRRSGGSYTGEVNTIVDLPMQQPRLFLSLNIFRLSSYKPSRLYKGLGLTPGDDLLGPDFRSSTGVHDTSTHFAAEWTEAISNAHLAQGCYGDSELVQNVVNFFFIFHIDSELSRPRFYQFTAG